MNRLQALLIHGVEHRFRQITLLGVLWLALLAIPLAHLTVDNDLEGWIDPQGLAELKSFQNTFGHEEAHLFAFGLRDLLQELPMTGDDPSAIPGTRLDLYLDWVATVAARPDVTAVLDPVSAYLAASEPGFNLDPTDEEGLRQARQRFLSRHSPAWGSLVSPDLRTLGLLIILSSGPGFHPAATLAELQGQFQHLGLPHHQAGVLWFAHTLTRELSGDLSRVISLLTLLAGLLLLLFFRSWAMVGAIFFGVAITIASSLALCLALGSSLNLLTLILFPLAFAVCLNTAIHLFGRREGGRWHYPHALEQVLHPALLATLTSAVGASSFYFAPQTVLVKMGVALPASVFIALFATLLFVPAAYRLLARGAPPPVLRLPDLTYITPGHRRWRQGISVALVVAGLAGGWLAGRLTVNPDAIFFFAESSPLVQSYRFIERELTGMLVIEAWIQATGQHNLDAPPNRQVIQAFVEHSRQLPDLTTVIRHEDLTGLGLQSHYLSPDHRASRVSLRFRNLAGHPIADLHEGLQQAWQQAGGPAQPLTLTLTGELPLLLTGQQELVTTQLQAFTGLFGTVCVILFLALRKVRILILAVAANALPLVIMAGVMVLAGIAVNSINLFVSSVMLGVVVDDTIHLLHAMARGGPLETAMATVADGLWITFVVLTLSFAGLLVADLIPLFQFGLLSTIALVVAHLCEVFLLPLLASQAEGQATP